MFIKKLHQQAFWQNFENEKLQKIGFCLHDLEKFSSPELLNRILRCCTQIALGLHHLHYQPNNSQRQFEHREFNANLEVSKKELIISVKNNQIIYMTFQIKFC